MFVIGWTAAHAACPAGLEALRADLREAEQAFGALDLARFEGAREALRADLGCLSAAPDAALVARAHGIDAIGAVVAKDDAAATAALRAARAADPTYALPLEVPDGHRLRQLLSELPPSEGPTSPFVAPAGTTAWVDGHERAERPLDRPAVAWLQAEGGAIPWSGWLPTGAPAPELSAYAVAPPPPPAPVRSGGGRIRAPLAVATAASAVAAGVFAGLAASASQRFADPATPFADLDGLRGRANTCSAGALGGLALTVGFGTATLVAREKP